VTCIQQGVTCIQQGVTCIQQGVTCIQQGVTQSFPFKPLICFSAIVVFVTVPRECIICGDLAAFECKECYQVHGAGLNTIAFCDGCKRTVSTDAHNASNDINTV